MRAELTSSADHDTGRKAAFACGDCVSWAIRYTVAMQASYYLTLHIVSPRLREHVLDDLAAGYAVALASKEVAAFAEYFELYTDRVERALDPEKLRRGEHMFEFRRVWANHAIRLGERQLRAARRAARARPRRG